MKDIERKYVDVLDLDYYTVTRLMRRQLPKSAGKKVVFAVRNWEGNAWLVVYRIPTEHPYYGWYLRENIIASAPTLIGTKRFERMVVGRALIDPELLAYILLVV